MLWTPKERGRRASQLDKVRCTRASLRGFERWMACHDQLMTRETLHVEE